jgi:hypothetical protein
MDDAAELREAAKSVFRADIEVSSRALNAIVDARRCVQLFGRSIGISDDRGVLAQILATSPACGDVLIKNGIPLGTLVRGPESPDGGPDVSIRERKYENLLRGLFTEPFVTDRVLNASGALVLASGLLTEIDVFAGLLEEGRSGIIPNSAVKAILDVQGMLSHWGFVTERGELLIDNVVKECRAWGNVDPAHSRQQIIIFLDEFGKVRLRPFGSSSFGALDDKAAEGLSFIYRSGVVQKCSSSSPFAQESLLELEELINSANTRERDFQSFFESNPKLLTGLDYASVHPHPVLYKDDGNSLIPDFLLEKVDPGWHAVLDLKLATRNMVIRKKNRVYFAQWIHEAIAQLEYYRTWFDDARNRENLASVLKLPRDIFRPKIVLVAGRNHHFADEIERLSLVAAQQRNLEIWTYDQLLSRAKRYREFVDATF